MRIDCGSINPKPVNPYNAATEKMTATRRSFQVRKKLAKRAAGVQGWSGVDKAPIIGQWMNGGRGQMLTKDQRLIGATGKDSRLR
jgi:hypothetical protein